MKLFDKIFRRDAVQYEAGRAAMEKGGFYRDALRRLRRDPMAVISFTVILLLVLLAVFAPVVTRYDPAANELTNKWAGASAKHLMGTDNMGRDIFSRIAYGARVSLSVGVIAECIAMAVGVTLGAVAGYFGGWVDALISRVMEIFASFPFMLFAILMTYVLGTGVINCFIAIGLVGWTGMARLIRSEVLRLKSAEPADPQLPAHHHRRAHHGYSRRYPAGMHPQLSGSWGAATHAKLGRDDQLGADVSSAAPHVQHLSRHRHRRHRAGL